MASFSMSDIAERIALLPPEKRALLAARLARSERRVHGSRQIPTRERGVPAPLSYNQRSVWFLDQLYPGNVAYNSPIAVRFSGRLDPEALEWSWNEVVRRHDLLRTVFELRDGDPVQYAKPFRPVRLRRMEFGQLPESERMEAAREEAVREAREPFNLASGPPWRAKLLCCSEREHVLVVILHHIICDGWSIGVLVRELVAGYEAFLRGETSPLRRTADSVCRLRGLATRAACRTQAFSARSNSGASVLKELRTLCSSHWTSRVQGSRLFVAPGYSRSFRRSSPNLFAGLLIRKGQHFSWCCWGPSRSSCRAIAVKATSSSDRKSPTENAASSKG